MQIKDKRKQGLTELFELKIGEAFEKNSKIYIKIGSFACLNVKEGTLEDFGTCDSVKKVNVKLVIEE